MTSILVGLVLIIAGLVVLTLQRFYSSVPLRELKRLSMRGDALAQALYRPAVYEKSLRLLLWLLAAVALPIGLMLVVDNTTGPIGFVVVALTLLVVLVWIPSLPLTMHTARFAAWLSPAVVAVVRPLHPVLDKVARVLGRGRALTPHSRLYEKEDLASLLAQQKDQPDNRIPQEELELVSRALLFDDKYASDIVLPRKQMHMVNADDTIGPILLDQLHKSGQRSFLVYKDDHDAIVGTLLMRDAVNARAGGKVGNLVRSDLCYVHEDFTLRQVLTAFQRTGHHLAIVLNSFDEIIGVISLDAVLAELVGEDKREPENYESRSAVAAYEPKELASAVPAEERPDLEEDLPTSPDETGVVK